MRLSMQWYEERRARLGIELMSAVRTAVRALQENPTRYPEYYQGFRRVLLRRFPHKIFYRFERERIIIFRILHAKQDHTQHLL